MEIKDKNLVQPGLVVQPELKDEVPEDRLVPTLSFIRRIFFLRDRPSPAICFYHEQGQVTPHSVERDWECEPELQKYLDQKDQVDVLEWTTPDPEVEEVCRRAAWLGVEKHGDSYKVIDASDTLPRPEISAEEVNEMLSFIETKVKEMSKEQKARLVKIQSDLGRASVK